MSTQKALECAREIYAQYGVDVDAAMKSVAETPVSIHCWQGDDVAGFENPDGDLTGGIQSTGNYPGKARTLDELRADFEFAAKMIPGKKKLALHAIYLDANGKKVTQLDLKFGGNKTLLSITTTQWSYEAIEKLPMDDAIVQLENQIAEEQNNFLNESVGLSRVEIPYQEAIGCQSHPLGNFIADAYLKHTNANVAIVDAGSIAAGIPGGAVTKADVLSILPNSNRIQTKKITPKALKTALESGLSAIVLNEDGTINPDSVSGKFPQIAGMTVAVNMKNEPGDRVIRMKLDSGINLNPADDHSLVTVASNSSVMSGQNDYDIFAMSPLEEEFSSEGQALLDYINTTEEYPEYQEARIQMTNQQKSYMGIIVTMFLVLVLVVMILVVIIKVMTRVS